MATVNFNYPKFKYTIASTGEPGAGYKLFTYEEGTSTKKTTWTSLSKTAENTNPIVLDANGEANVWIDGNYKFVLAPPTDTDPPTSPVWTVDAIRSSNGGGSVSSSTDNALPINGSFETDSNSDGAPDSWTLAALSGGTIAINSASSTHGTNSLKFTSSGSGGGSATTDDYYEVEEGQVLPIHFSLISANVDTLNKVEVYWYDSSKIFVSSTTVYSEGAANPTSWTRYHYSPYIPSTVKYAKVVLTGVDAASTTHSNTSFDNVVINSIDTTSGKRGAVVYRGSAQSIPDSADTAVQFDSELYDTSSIHSTTVNNTRLTVPSGVSKVRIHANIGFSNNATGLREVTIAKNGLKTYVGRGRNMVLSVGATYDTPVETSTSILNVAPGDYFEAIAWQNSGGALNTDSGSGVIFEMEIIE